MVWTIPFPYYQSSLGRSRLVSTHHLLLTMKHSYTLDQLQIAVNNAQSIRQVLELLGIASKGGNYATLKRRLKKYNIDTSHFTGQAHAKGKSLPHKVRPIEEYLTNQAPIGSYRLKRRLISEGILKPVCSGCNLSAWLDQSIPLELDHIDGCPENNTLDNLRLLCPNCHALTDTYRGKNQTRAKKD